MTEKVYSRVVEAEEIIKKLCERQPDVLWCVKPEMVAVLGIENKERSDKNKTLAKIKPVKGGEKALLQFNNIPVRYIVEVYWSDWHEWKERKRQWVIFHELLHIHHEIGKSIKHDCEDWRILIDKVGVDWVNSDKLPDLINDKVEFKLDLRPSLGDVEEETDDIEDDEENKERQKNKKEREAKKIQKKNDPSMQSEVVKKGGEDQEEEKIYREDEAGNVF